MQTHNQQVTDGLDLETDADLTPATASSELSPCPITLTCFMETLRAALIVRQFGTFVATAKIWILLR